MNYVTVSKLQSKLEGEVGQVTVRKLIDKMTQDGFVEAKSNRRLGMQSEVFCGGYSLHSSFWFFIFFREACDPLWSYWEEAYWS